MTWIEKEDLQTPFPSINHMCGTMKREGKRYLVVVGGKLENGETLSNCSYNYFPEEGWQSCQNLHEPLEGGQLINDPETGDLLLLGGRNGNNDQNTIYRLSDIDGEWMLEEQTMMKVGRRGFSAMFLPDGIINCDQSVNEHDEL